MSDYSKSHVVSIRLESGVLDSVREQARAEGRSVAGELAFLVKEQVKLRYSTRRGPEKITGWLAHLSHEGSGVPDSFAEFANARAELSAKLVAVAAQRGPTQRRPARARKGR